MEVCLSAETPSVTKKYAQSGPICPFLPSRATVHNLDGNSQRKTPLGSASS